MVLIWITSWHTSSTALPRSCLLILTWTTLSLVYIHFPALRLQGHSEWAWRKIHSLANCLTLNWWLLAWGAPHCCSAFKPCFAQAPRWLFHFSLLQANVHHHLPYPQSQLITWLPNSSREGMKKNQLHRLQASHACHLLVSVPVNCAFHAVHLEQSWDPAYGQPLPILAKVAHWLRDVVTMVPSVSTQARSDFSYLRLKGNPTSTPVFHPVSLLHFTARLHELCFLISTVLLLVPILCSTHFSHSHHSWNAPKVINDLHVAKSSSQIQPSFYLILLQHLVQTITSSSLKPVRHVAPRTPLSTSYPPTSLVTGLPPPQLLNLWISKRPKTQHLGTFPSLSTLILWCLRSQGFKCICMLTPNYVFVAKTSCLNPAQYFHLNV